MDERNLSSISLMMKVLPIANTTCYFNKETVDLNNDAIFNSSRVFFRLGINNYKNHCEFKDHNQNWVKTLRPIPLAKIKFQRLKLKLSENLKIKPEISKLHEQNQK